MTFGGPFAAGSELRSPLARGPVYFDASVLGAPPPEVPNMP